MFLKIIDELIDKSFRNEPDYKRLECLESDVWERIRRENAKIEGKNPPRRNKTAGVSLFAAFFGEDFTFSLWSSRQFRYACLVIALVAGLAASQLSPSSDVNSTQSVRADALGLEFFSPNAPYLISSTAEYTDSSRS